MSAITNSRIQFQASQRHIECNPEIILKVIKTAVFDTNPITQASQFESIYENFRYLPLNLRTNDEMEMAFINLMMCHALCQDEPKQTHQLEYALIRLLFLMDSYPHFYEWPKFGNLETFSDDLFVFRTHWFRWCGALFNTDAFKEKAACNPQVVNMMNTVLRQLIHAYFESEWDRDAIFNAITQEDIRHTVKIAFDHLDAGMKLP